MNSTDAGFSDWLIGIAVPVSLILLVLSGCTGSVGSDGFVEDRAGLLSDGQRDRIDRINRQLLEELGIHLKTVILKESPADINAAAVELFDRLRLGGTTRGAKGVLFLVDPAGKQVRLEIGYDLEGIFTDAFIGYVERRQMLPFFQAGRVGPGVEATAELLVGQAMGAEGTLDSELALKPPDPGERLSGGGGARIDVEIGSGVPQKPRSPLADGFGPQSTPQKALETYKMVLRNHVKDPELTLYTKETRRFLRQWLVTDAQQDNELNAIVRNGGAGEVILSEDRAVIRFPLSNRQASPFFFRKGPDGWMLDFAAMNHSVGFNHKNQWFFRTSEHDFMFAFNDMVFDRNGFPHKRP
ncbi:MAG: TPM domain-containing protein [Desulfobacterales bacterium]